MKTANGKSNYRRSSFQVFLTFLALGILFSTSGTSGAETGKILWKSREQFVAIEKRDMSVGQTNASNHPASLSAPQLRNMLKEPEIIEAGKSKPLPIFNEPEREILVQYILEALNQANPQEDVTFAVIGQFPVLMGLASERKVTTGRVFIEDGKLNVIFGMIHRDVNDREDRRLAPFIPGSRSRAADLAGRIIPSDQTYAIKRADWIVFPLSNKDFPAEAPASSGTSPLKVEELRPSVPQTGSAVKEDQMTARPDKRRNSVEERLIILNELKQKQLITDEEYRTKRKSILDEL